MTDLATVGFGVDAAPLEKGADALDRFGAAGDRAANSNKKFTDTQSRLGKEAEAAGQRTRRATDEIAAGADKASKGADKVKRATDALGKGTTGLGGALNSVKARFLGFAGGADAAAAASGRLTAAVILLKTGLGALGLALSVGALTGMADTWSDLNSRVGLAVQNMELAPEVMERISSMARRTYSPLEQTAESFIANSTALRELGLNTRQQLDYTEALNNAFVVSGAKGDVAASVSNALSKAMASGALRGENLNSVIERGGRVAELLAERLGTTVSGLRKLGTEGKITSDVIYTGVVGALETLREEADAMPATVGDAFTLIRNRALELVGGFDQATGASAALSQALITVADNLDLVASLAAGLAAAFATRLAVSLVSAAIPALATFVVSTGQAIIGLAAMTTAQGAAATAASVLAGALAKVRIALISLGFPALVMALASAIYGFQRLARNVGGVGNAFAILKAVATDALQGVWDAIQGAMAITRAWDYEARAAALRMGSGIADAVIPRVNQIIAAFVGAKDAIAVVWQQIPAVLQDAMAGAVNWVISGTESMVNAALSGVAKLINGIMSIMPEKAREFLGVAGSVDWSVDLSAYKMEVSGAAKETAGLAMAAIQAAGEVEYLSNSTGENMRAAAAAYDQAATSARGSADAYFESARGSLESAKALGELVKAGDEEASTAADIATNLNTVGDAADKAGKKAKKAGDKGKKATKDAQKGLTEVAKAARKFAEELQGKVITAIESASDAMADWITRGFRDFKKLTTDIVGAFRTMLSQMIAMAIKNKILIGVGLDPLGQALSAAGVPGVGGGFGGGMLGGLLGKGLGSFAAPAAGGLLGGLGGVWGGVSAGWGSGGLMGAISGGIGSSFAGISSGLSMGGIAGITGAIGAAIPIIAGVAAVVKIGKALFGRRLKDTGIEATFSMAEGLAASTYKFYKGGLFRSNKTKRSNLDDELADPLERSFKEIGTSVLEMSKAVGIADASLKGFTYSFKFSTKGMSQEEIAQKLQEEFEKYGDAATKAAAKEIHKFLRQGESAYEGLQRLSTALLTANRAFDMMGKSLYATSLKGADLASELADLFGGAGGLQSATENYFSKFFSEAEQLQWLNRQATAALKEVGLSMPKTRDEFRALVDGLDLTTESGRKSFAALMELTDVFDKLYPAVDESLSGWADAAKSLRDVIAGLRKESLALIGGMEQLMFAEREYNGLRNRALKGDLESAKLLGKSATDYLDLARGMSGTAVDYALRAARVEGQLGEVADYADSKGTPEEKLAAAFERSTNENVAVPNEKLRKSNEALQKEVGSLREELANIFKSLVEIQVQQSKYAKRTSETLRKWDADGQPADRGAA